MPAIYCDALISFTIYMDSRHLLASLQDRLGKIYPIEEARAIARQLLEHFSQYTYARLLAGVELDKDILSRLDLAMKELLTFRPLQYVLGETVFLERIFKVNEAVLIPRPETEEMVWRILKEIGPSYEGKILDVGTGSGCIAISLALGCLNASVYAVDLSSTALEIARSNALNLAATVQFQQLDFLEALPDSGPFDLIISNPPYIPDTERADMDPHVVEFEPHSALFVEDPLIFFRRLAFTADDLLKDGGMLLVEGHYAYMSEVAQVFKQAGLNHVEVLKDFQGKPRFARALK
jgi:release factor glutamine methyltransferase